MNNVSIAKIVGEMLAERKMTIAVAESCTGGLVSSMFTDVPGSSRYFERGYVTYSDRSKVELLGVSEDTLEKFGAVSGKTALEMAKGVRRTSGADVGVGVTGIAGPSGGSAEKPVGTVFIAVAGPWGEATEGHVFSGDRLGCKQMAAATALDVVRKKLVNFRGR